MKKCIKCGRNNGVVKMEFVGAECEYCFRGEKFKEEVKPPKKRVEEVVVKKRYCAKCEVVLRENNCYIRKDGRKDCYCKKCKGELVKNRYRESGRLIRKEKRELVYRMLHSDDNFKMKQI